jgi:hypothetical protein
VNFIVYYYWISELCPLSGTPNKTNNILETGQVSETYPVWNTR